MVSFLRHTHFLSVVRKDTQQEFWITPTTFKGKSDKGNIVHTYISSHTSVQLQHFLRPLSDGTLISPHHPLRSDFDIVFEP
jgi:hypothetical protein